jgi:predicted ATP-binding protein involved in virulence
MRSVPLEVGKTYEFNRYYHVDRNPVVIQVVRKERIKVPAGEFDAIVVKPIIKSKGLFSENGQAEVWFSDDSSRTLLRLKSKLSFGTLYLELK